MLNTAFAQDKEFRATTTKQSIIQKRPVAAAGEKIQIKATGVVIMMSERGLEVINPLAPSEMGRGEKFVTKNIKVSTGDNNTELTNEDKRPYGGIILVGLEF